MLNIKPHVTNPTRERISVKVSVGAWINGVCLLACGLFVCLLVSIKEHVFVIMLLLLLLPVRDYLPIETLSRHL